MMKSRPMNRFTALSKKEHRFAVVDCSTNEIMTANHRSVGEAFNSITDTYTNNSNLIVVSHLDRKILGEVGRTGSIKKRQEYTLPENIWSGFGAK
jgi:hypothetical protein